MNKRITVLGAGSVGVGTAIHLQQRGWQVTLIDRKQPATETSYGNAGIINASSFIPVNNPSLLKKLPGILLNNKSYVRYQLSHVLQNLPWLYHFLKAANKKTTIETAKALGKLAEGALDEHKALMQRSGNMHRLRESGWLKVFRTGAGYNPDSLEAQLNKQFNINIQTLSAGDIKELEPSLSPIYKNGYLLNDSAGVNNPGALIKEYAAQFCADGGTLLEANVNAISFDQSNNEAQFKLKTPEQDYPCEHLVIAAGPWSDDLLRPLGYRVMLGFERGYHQHFEFINGASLSRPVYDVDCGFIIIPMQQGARVTTGVELNHRDAPSRLDQLNEALPRAREAIALGNATEDRLWRGCRPSFPDSKPVIDRAPLHENLWLAFGHQHIGLMTGPISGKLLAQKICREATDIDLTPFAASRWIKPA